MLFTTFLPALALISSVLSSNIPRAETKATLTARQPTSDVGANSLFSRSLVGLTACVSLAADIPLVITPPQIRVNLAVGTVLVANVGALLTTLPVTVKAGVCLCTDNGVLTPTSIANLAASLNLGAGVNVGNILNLFGLADLTAVANLIQTPLVALIPTPTCSYPTVGTFTPVCGTPCQYECSGMTTQRCNGGCILPTEACPTGGIGTLRRSFNPALLCPAGLTACGLGKGSNRFTGAFECLDTKSNIETCGGCEFPLPGQPTGQDCSTIENVSAVSCVAGKCVINTCQRGFEAIGLECVKV